MEDWNTLALDCTIISCFCQCLILQIIVFIFLKLPHKLVQKTIQYATKKLGQRKREMSITGRQMGWSRDEYVAVHGRSARAQVEGLEINECRGCGCCMEEVEEVLEELSQKGEFAFGSFWGREESGSLPTSVAKQEFDYMFYSTI